GTIGAKPTRLPLSIGDGELAETADAVVSVPEIFAYWLQGGRIDVGFLGAAQIDRFGNLNSTVVGDYRQPKVRLPGAGGAPEIALSSQEVFVVVRQNPKSFVEKLDFLTTEGGRANLRAVITDLGILRPQQDTRELVLVAYHPGVSLDEIRAATGWPLKVAETLEELPPPTASELAALHDLHRKTRETHELPARSLRGVSGVSAPAGS